MFFSKLMMLCLCSVLMVSAQRFPDDFPLWGSSWVVCEGRSGNIVESVADFNPRKAVLLRFNASRRSIDMHYANLDHRPLFCTADALIEVESQFSKNAMNVSVDSINQEYGSLDISWHKYDDTLYSVNKFLCDSWYSSYIQCAYIRVGNTERWYDNATGYQRLLAEKDSSFFDEKPFCYYGVRADWGVFNRFTLPIELMLNGKRTLVYIKGAGEATSLESDDFDEYLDKSSGILYKRCSFYEKKTQNIGYWQLHVHPEVWYFKRNVDNGQPMMDERFKMAFKEALRLKKESLLDKDNVEKKYDRDPFLSDSASVIISCSFIGKKSANTSDYISLCNDEGSRLVYNHIPGRMARVRSVAAADLRFALLSCYGEDSTSETIRHLLKCYNWERIDRENSLMIYPFVSQKRVKDTRVDESLFIYNGCPCSKTPLGGMTKAQLVKYLYFPVPSCNRAAVEKSMRIYRYLFPLLDEVSHRRILTQRLATAEALLKTVVHNGTCSHSWIDADVFNSFF